MGVNKVKLKEMKTLSKLSSKAIEFCDLSGYAIDKIREAMKCDAFVLQRCETMTEMNEEGVDYSFPYIVFNPYNIDIDQ